MAIEKDINPTVLNEQNQVPLGQEDMNIAIEAITGTSIGSINGAYYIQEGSENLTSYWETMEPRFLIPSEYKAFTEMLEVGHCNNYKELLFYFKP